MFSNQYQKDADSFVMLSKPVCSDADSFALPQGNQGAPLSVGMQQAAATICYRTADQGGEK
jgi:hypothetical protein